MSSLQAAGARIFAILIIFALIIVGTPALTKSRFSVYTTIGISMEPTIHEGDHFLLYKKTYDSNHAPAHGDLIVIKNHRSGEPATIFKRVIGVPGDTVEIKGHDIYINSVLVQRESVGNGRDGYNEFRETLPDGTDFHIYENKNDGARLSLNGLYKVPPGNVFVVGDNRDNSYDSRSRRGYISYEDIVGKELFFY